MPVFNPIIRAEPFKWGMFQSVPSAMPGTALVFTGNAPPLVLYPGQRIGRGELRWNKYTYLYQIDIADHLLTIQSKLPCSTDAFEFDADVNFLCSVDNPLAIVHRNLTNVDAFIEPMILQIMRDVSRRYNVDQSGDAEQAITMVVKDRVYEAGFKLNRFIINLKLEDEVRATIREQKTIAMAMQIDQAQHDRQMSIDRQKQAQLQANAEFYATQISKGPLGLLALIMANKPDDLVTAYNTLTEQRQLEWQQHMQQLKFLVDNDALEGVEISELGRRILPQLITYFEKQQPHKALDEGAEGAETVITGDVKPDFNFDND